MMLISISRRTTSQHKQRIKLQSLVLSRRLSTNSTLQFRIHTTTVSLLKTERQLSMQRLSVLLHLQQTLAHVRRPVMQPPSRRITTISTSCLPMLLITQVLMRMLLNHTMMLLMRSHSLVRLRTRLFRRLSRTKTLSRLTTRYMIMQTSSVTSSQESLKNIPLL